MRKNIYTKKYIFFLFLILIVCSLLGGCKNTEEKVTEITFIHGWGTSEADHEAMRQIYKEFENEHPEIHLNMIAMPSAEDVVSKVGDLLTVGKAPDVVFMAGDGRETVYKHMVEKGYALDLMPYLEADEELYGSFSPMALDYWRTEEGKLYTVSDVSMMVGYWYNTDMFQKAGISAPPATWDEWKQVCSRLKQSNPQITPFVLDEDHIVYLTNVMLYEEDPAEIENLRRDFVRTESMAFQRVLERLKNFSEYTDTLDAYSFRDSLNAFNEEKTAIYLNGVWANSLIDETLNVAYAAFPSEKGSSVAMISSGVGYILGNTGDEKRMEASVEFVKYMLSEPVAQKLLEKTGQIPANPDFEITEQTGNERLRQAVECMKSAENVIEIPANIWSLKLQKAYAENVRLYLDDKITIEDMQDNLKKLY